MEKRGVKRFFFVEAVEQLQSLFDYQSRRFRDVYESGRTNERKTLISSFIDTIRNSEEQRLLQNLRLAKASNTSITELNKLSVYTYNLILEDYINSIPKDK